ncbi:hypothetical protein SAMN02745702_01490 [Desulfobaculum bizertense DSM 18034]|uniref:Uncharacterized protein n=1 Tax=Desulfobaculum bizertense DSM 18034 TaxID=1121442 RepID=A0A1T4W333_9BACT|nr:hypothetical protein SAMN02745702_01490 [Desulfobaculum bizertense DSM 18034]
MKRLFIRRKNIIKKMTFSTIKKVFIVMKESPLYGGFFLYAFAGNIDA